MAALRDTNVLAYRFVPRIPAKQGIAGRLHGTVRIVNLSRWHCQRLGSAAEFGIPAPRNDKAIIALDYVCRLG